MVENRAENVAVYDPLQPKEPKKFPFSVILIIINEFCERFSYSGMRAFLALYLKDKLLYSDDEATETYHTFSTLAYFFPLFGAILADSYLGKFRTILYLMVVYVLGNITVAVTAIPILGIPGRTFTMVGLMLIALGTGGIKPCVSAFGGEQFVLPEQQKQLTLFFSLFYFTICFGSLIAKSFTPLLRSEVHCFGDKDCYSLAFGAPGLLIILSIVLFMCGKRMYVIKKPTGKAFVDFFKCVSEALRNRNKNQIKGKAQIHWLDNAKNSYDQSFIDDVKRTLNMFLLFTPLIFFWSLLDQLGSRWTLQASRMDGKFSYFTVRPDQMQVLCPILILLLIPVLNKVVYPGLIKVGLRKPLHKLLLGCSLVCFSFVASGCLELHLEKTYPIQPSEGFGQLRIFNGYNCHLNFTSESHNFSIPPLQHYENYYIQSSGKRNLLFNKSLICSNFQKNEMEKIQIEEGKAISYLYIDSSEEKHFNGFRYEDHNEKSRSGRPMVRILTNPGSRTNPEITLVHSQNENFVLTTNSTYTDLLDAFASEYHLYANSQFIPLSIDLRIGGVYTILINVNDDLEYNARLITITSPNSVTMAWVLPQMIIISASEVLVSITGLEFAFTEAPESMKSVLQAYWYFVEALGNVVIILVTRLGSDYRQVTHFFFFATMMAFATVAFFFLMRSYHKMKATMLHNASIELNEKTVMSMTYKEVPKSDLAY